MEQKYDESSHEYLNLFLIWSEFRASSCFFHPCLIPGSLLLDNLLQELARDMNVVIQKAEGVFWVLESRWKMTKSIALIYALNASALSLQLSQDGNKRKGHYDLASGDKRQRHEASSSNRQYNKWQGKLGGTYDDYSSWSSRRGDQSWEPLPKYDLNTGLEVIYKEDKAKGIFHSPLKISVPDYMKNKNKYCKFH